jgi:hypothetical protein
MTGGDWDSIDPTCPAGTHFDPASLQCVSNIPPPPPPAPFPPLHRAGWFGEHEHGWHGHEGRDHEHDWHQRFHEFLGAPPPALAQHAEHSAEAHANQAQAHARAAEMHPSAHGRVLHARAAQAHHEAALRHDQAGRGHRGELHGRSFNRAARGRGGIFSRLFGGGRGRFARGWQRGGRYGLWLGGTVGAAWVHHRAQCIRRNMSGACLKEMILWPQGYRTYRLTPQGEAEQVQLEVVEQSANDQVQQQTGQAVPDASTGPMPGSEPQQAPADDASSDVSSDAGDAGGDAGSGHHGHHHVDAAADSADASKASDDATQASVDADHSDAIDASGGAADAAATATATTGNFAGWQDPFTTPYPGYMNMGMPAAWDSSFEYPFLVPRRYW